MSANSTFICSSVFEFDDFTACGRHILLDGLIPGVVAILSALYVITRLSVRNSCKKHHYSSNNSAFPNVETQPLLSTPINPLENNDNSYGAASSNGGIVVPATVTQRHFDIAKLEAKKDDGSPHGYVEIVFRSLKERIRVCIEEILLIAHVGIAICTLVIPELADEWVDTPFIPKLKLGIWTYALIICTIRLANLSNIGTQRLPNLWNHSVFLYTASVFPSALTMRTALLGTINSKIVNYYYIFDFIISALLFVNIYSAEIGDKPAKLYITDKNTLPSPESKSSLFSIASYSWLNGMVWKAYGEPMLQKDIWSLKQEDYAFNVVQAFEQMKSNMHFAGRLFKFFRYILAVQAIWAILDSFIIFAPSILLKKILEYVDHPEDNSRSLAWLFVFLMLFFKLTSSMFTGRSLFLGRRLSTQMKAIIIAEVYAKALRRRITTDQVQKANLDPPTNDKSTLQLEDETSGSGSFENSSGEESKEKEDAKKSDLGAIINLMAVDAFKVSEISSYLHYFVSSFLMIAIAIFLLYKLLGWSALVGAAVIIILLPVNYKISEKLGDSQKEMLAITDKRIQKLNETFQSIRIIKFFAWERKFFEEVMKIRNEELIKLTKRSIFWACSATLWFTIPTLITLVSFFCYIIIDGKTLTSPIAFTSLSLFNLLRSPLDELANMLSFVIQSKVSMDRVQNFLDEEDTTKYEQLSHPRTANSPEIGFENATFSWNKTHSGDFKLRDLNIAFKKGKLNVIIGPTGSGKTSLLLALLGEMELLEGNVYLPGVEPRDELKVDPSTGLAEAVAYCSQAAWLLNDTIRNNIIFAAPFDQERYDSVVKACGLVRDFEILEGGDNTEIGEKGITLSGGQKQRVSLARALYSNAKHVLLDDCLSAVDSHTALWIYDNCITGPLMKGRTCILVSHNVALTVTAAEWVVVLENGRIKNQGTPSFLLKEGDLGDDELVKSSVNASSSNLKSLNDKNKSAKLNADKIEAKLKKVIAEEAAAYAQEGSSKQNDENDEDFRKLKNKKIAGKLVEEETKKEGSVKFQVYADYAKSFGTWPLWILLASGMLGSQAIYILQSWWLREWAMSSETNAGDSFSSVFVSTSHAVVSKSMDALNKIDWNKPIGGETFRVINSSKHGTFFYLILYSVIGFIYSGISAARIVITFLGGISASNKIFEKMLRRVLRAKLRFFDATPIGRIMNRFSKDMESVDQELPPFAEAFIMCLIQCFATIGLICFITPAFLIFAIFILFFYYLVGIFYLSLSRELKRYDSVTRSPIHQHFTETLVGVPTIRAYGDERRFMTQNLNKIDENNRPYFYLWIANRWLSFRVDAVGAFVTFFSGVFILLSINKLDSGLAGLSLSYAIAFSDGALWVVRLYANVEMSMNSVERLQEYLLIDQEAAETTENDPLPNTWPSKGAIEVRDVSLRYAPDLPRVINNVTFNVEPNSKVGIVGRTGAGKSTIITAFFRFLDPETGYIKIDGVDITKIGLRALRQGITIIPQDPTLFTGTIRSNLDLFDQYSDEEIYQALKRVNLISAEELALVKNGQSSANSSDVGDSSLEENTNKFLNLNNKISEGGSNLSQGQRQLMCLARSLLKSPKVILLDEATASIDYASDAKIQHTIRDEFAASTILTIAHRLRSIIDYDKILVMDAGKVVEYDDPYTLILDKSSLFHSMCENSGELDVLVQLAKENFIKKGINSRK
ncbi:hypothetical protein PACTADRAFT_48088 [Pachysolen tannophilus NRRL Y-2460]|uniref:ATP-dependent bile acid permease n=1 Tax=Pachysolen tannophilus NRRL Y-2460 TaxID=669874 RepID=A0A1E4U2S7_PACTA|nr:hypothetical protein PACTADRAFT_48088 [Pachysolen tannophilus NRRL Y-2460]